ncbi:MmgE/PrpD family protein [Pararoseomonas indoligenes]|uniref:MmgE/PrpD family protein n=1 Tax=Roseomonas indoligenes TaxID=2820811 RepID=A0A940MVM8_9PROT|nr:MmgE/PrpD family protein [Pararoseomonas indoligenes]MBP0491805.1 MmgE/PrpD family protein [Pararoseomonas indoligenes]
MENPLLQLADYAVGWRGRPIEPELEAHARRALLDWFASLLPGCSQPPATTIAEALGAEGATGRAVCYVDGTMVPLRHAALVNGTAGHLVEFDDIYRDAGYHPACPTMPAALAAAQVQGASMQDLLRAIIAGYEVGCRIGMAVQPSHYRYWHTTGTVGTFGAAAAVSVLLGLDEARTAHALATAATMAAGLQGAIQGEGMSKPLHAGHAAEAGALAAMAAARGMTGTLEVLHAPAGFAAATSDSTGRWEAALEGLGGPPAITRITFKNHGCCGHIFPALDAVTALRDEHGFGAGDVAAVHVAGYTQTKTLCDRPDPRTVADARFSVQYCVSALLHLGGVRLAAFEAASMADPAIRADMVKVTVAIDPEMADAYPRQRSARVTIRLRDGRVLERYQPTRKGDPDAPLSDAELTAKFRELVGPAIGSAAAARLERSLLHGDALPGPIPLAGAAIARRRVG